MPKRGENFTRLRAHNRDTSRMNERRWQESDIKGSMRLRGAKRELKKRIGRLRGESLQRME